MRLLYVGTYVYMHNLYVCLWPLILLKKLVRLGCITQGSLAEITNQRFSLKYQMFRQLAAAFISGSGLLMKAAASCRNVWYFKENLWLVISAKEP